MGTFNTIIVILNLLLLAVASAFDIKKTEVPIRLSASIIAVNLISAVVSIVRGEGIVPLLITLGLLIILTIPFAFKGGLGGADILIEFGLALTLRYYTLHLIMFSNFFCLPQAVIVQRKNKEYPFVPYLLAGYIAVLIWRAIL